MNDYQDYLELITCVCEQGKIEFSPETAGDAEWAAFMSAARNACSRGVNHPVKGAFWRNCQSRLAGLSELAADPQGRQALAIASRERKTRLRDEALVHLREALMLMRAQGNVIDPSDRTMLVDEYVTPSGGLVSGADLDMIIAQLGMSVGARTARTVCELIPAAEMSRLRTELEVFGTDSLYAFLQLRMDTPAAAITQRIEQLKAEWSTKRADHRKSAAAACLSAAQKYLAQPELRHRYEVSWAHQRLADNKFLGKMKIAARDGVIDAAECEQLVAAADGLGVARKLALDVMHVVAAAEGFSIREPAAAVPVPVAPTPAPRPVAPMPYPAPTPAPGVIPPYTGAAADGSLMSSSERMGASLCYLIPLYSVYLILTRADLGHTRHPELHFAAYQSLGVAGICGVCYILAFALPPLWLVVWGAPVFLAVQAWRGVPAKVPVVGEWALRKAA